MDVALVERGISAQAVQVAVAIDIVNPHPLAAGEHDIQRVVIVRAVLFFKLDVFCAYLIDLGDSKQARQDRLLGMQAVVRLGEDRRMRAIGNLIGQLLAAVRRQAVHHDRILDRASATSFGIHLVGREDLLADAGFFLLAHAGPGIGVDDVRSLDGLVGVAQQGTALPVPLRSAGAARPPAQVSDHSPPGWRS